jgi:hypothetical protein
MKKVSYKLPFTLLFFALLCISFNSFSQVSKSKKQKKVEKVAQETIEYQALGTLLETKKIAYQTEIVQGSTGIKVYNIVQIDDSRFYVRCENPPNTSGQFSGARDNTTPNISPMTGIFFDGNVENWKLTTDPKTKYYIIKFNALDKNGQPWGEITMKAYTDQSASLEILSRTGGMIYSNYTGKVRAL